MAAGCHTTAQSVLEQLGRVLGLLYHMVILWVWLFRSIYICWWFVSVVYCWSWLFCGCLTVLEVGSSSSIGVDCVPVVMSAQVHVVVLSPTLPYAAPPDRLLNDLPQLSLDGRIHCPLLDVAIHADAILDAALYT